MISIYIFLFLSIILEIFGKEEFVPTLVWTSREFEGRKNIDYLADKRVKNDLFEAYMMEVLGNKKPLIVVFLEQDLSTGDFLLQNDDGNTYFPFLCNLMTKSRVDYFGSVDSPIQTITQLEGKGFNLKKLKPDSLSNFEEGDLLLMEFPNIDDERLETLRKHDKRMEQIHQQLVNSGKTWISIYTALHSRNDVFLSNKMQLWPSEELFPDRSARTLSLYLDEFTGLTLLTKGSLQLLVPSAENTDIITLENYLVASARTYPNGMDFSIWFSNYSVTLYLKPMASTWVIHEAKLLNGNGDSLKLVPSQRGAIMENKCYVRMTEFESEGRPVVKLIVSKYRILRLPLQECPCRLPYAFYLTFFLIFASIAAGVICWMKAMEKIDFSKKSPQSKISISKDTLISIPKTVS